MTQITSAKTCKQKHMYHSYKTAKRAKDRRNKRAGINYLRAYKCNVCNFWHVTTEVKDGWDE